MESQSQQPDFSKEEQKKQDYVPCNNTLQFVFGETQEHYLSQAQLYCDLSDKKAEKNCKKYAEPLKIKNQNCFFVVKFKVNPENNEDQNKKNFAEFQKLIKNLFITLKSLNKKAKEYIKNITLTYAHVKNEFCVGVQVAKDWEETLFALYEGIQMTTNIELSELQKRLACSIEFSKGINKHIVSNDKEFTKAYLLQILDNFIINAKLSISMTDLLDILRKTPLKIEKIEDQFYHIIYFLKKLKSQNVKMEFENLNNKDYEEIFQIEQSQLNDVIKPVQLPWKINILPKILNLFHTACEPQVEVSFNLNKVFYKGTLTTDGVFDSINKLLII